MIHRLHHRPGPSGKALTEEHRNLLTHLALFGEGGLLTANLALSVFGPSARTSHATSRMQTLRRRGLARQHDYNRERWSITDAGREAIA